MSNKIFRAIWSAAILVFLASLIFIMGISYSYFTSIQRKQLRNLTEVTAQGVAISGMDFFGDLNVENYRVTWIDAHGDVLYDNEAKLDGMKNHLEREEVKEAFETGYGESTRYSGTLAEKQLYSAKRLSDGTIIRLSIVQMAVWTLVLGFAQPIFFVILIALVLSLTLASRLAKKIVKPINEIDVNNLERYYQKDNYREIEPLLRQISAQQKQLKEDQKEIESAALIRQEFTANVSHELKTPLHAISGYAELLENGLVEQEDIIPFASKIHNESNRLSKLVEDIIDLTQLDHGGSELVWESCDLYMIIKNTIKALESTAELKNVTIQLSGHSAPIVGSPQTLYSIVYNLCDNAIKYNKSGGSVQVSIAQNGNNTILVVKDNGIGIPDSSKERIFERFYRVDKSRSKVAGGTGLGLSIVKHGVRIHNGKIALHSKIDEGTTFIVSIPNTQKQ